MEESVVIVQLSEQQFKDLIAFLGIGIAIICLCIGLQSNESSAK